MNHRIYCFGHGQKSGTSWIETTDAHPGYYIINCPVCGTQGLLSYPRVMNHRAGIIITRPGTLDDIIFLGPSVWAMSRKAQEAVCDGGLTGIRWNPPIEITSMGKSAAWRNTARQIRHFDMRIASIIGRGGSIAKTSKVRITSRCDYCGWITWSRHPRTIRVDAGQWDGSDFFVIDEYRDRLFTQRAADTLISAGLSGFVPELAGIIVAGGRRRE